MCPLCTKRNGIYIDLEQNIRAFPKNIPKFPQDLALRKSNHCDNEPSIVALTDSVFLWRHSSIGERDDVACQLNINFSEIT